VELAGLEPATSWVRLTREPFRLFAIVRHSAQQSRASRIISAVGSRDPSRLFDQNLTAG